MGHEGKIKQNRVAYGLVLWQNMGRLGGGH